ncbi:type IIG restriction enzyme/methyltransferase [Helicobacter sp. T3_23-1056]
MLKVQPLSPKDIFIPHFYKTPISETEFIAFKKHLSTYKDKLEQNKMQNEDFLVANALSPLLENLGLKTQIKYKQKGKSKIDLVLSKENEIDVIIEAKKWDSKDRFSATNPSAKALLEAMLYYFRAREDNHTGIKAIILTDFYEMYVFSAQFFEEEFYKHHDLASLYANFTATNSLFKGNTQEFYTQAKKILDSSDIVLQYLHIHTSIDSHFLALKPAFKTLSRDFLFGEFSPNDANVLNEKFYKELLYIMGLSEVKQNGRILIKPNSSTQGNLYNAILDKLPQDLREFDEAMCFVVLWLNRILFLKLIEANLTRFNQSSQENHNTKSSANANNLKFLNLHKIPNFKSLSVLFFEILAKEPNKRNLNSPLSFLPYLNSSLFEKHKCEESLSIAELSDSAKLEYFAQTQIKDKNGKQKCGMVGLLAYLFEFLDSFDFGSDEEGELIEQKELISSSVLGLVFEKLNGYKEGSFYTPSFITSYMCKESLGKIVVSRFNEKFNWQCENLQSLRTQVDRNFNALKCGLLETLREIKICDPSVGSGHFLVAALNEMIAIYDVLGLIEHIPSGNIIIQNDEIIVRERSGKNFSYAKTHIDNENHKIQKTLFGLKKSIIENNLYGVDINPNSVEICKLRLWIELLKNSYYLLEGDEGFDKNLDSTIHQMQTLPNIDINIKCGNSLISYFDLGQDLSHYPNIAKKIKNYQEAVLNYKDGIFDSRKQINDKIYELRQSFRNFCFSDKFKKEIKSFRAKCETYAKKYGNFLAKDDENLRLYVAQMFGYFTFDEKQAKKVFANLKKEYESIFYLESNKPFEWRLEFPEVLDSNGDFMGFDLVIGNPPYIRQEEIKELKPHLQKAFKIFANTSDIFTYFYEKGLGLLKSRGILHLITSNKFCRAGYGENLRKFLLESTTILDFVDLGGIKVFDKATVDTCIVNLLNAKPTKSHIINYVDSKQIRKANEIQSDDATESKRAKREISLLNLTYTQIPQDSLNAEAFIFADSRIHNLKAKIEKIGTPLKKWDIAINYGIKTGYNEAFIIDTATKEAILKACDNSNKSRKAFSVIASEQSERGNPQRKNIDCHEPNDSHNVAMLTEKERTEQIIKPILRGQDIKRYSYEWANLWLINTHNGYTMQDSNKIPPIDTNDYPALKAHFDRQIKDTRKKGKGLFERDDKGITPYNLRNCAYLEDFEKEKIIYKQIMAKGAGFCLDNQKFFTDTTATIITGENLKYLLGLLNSKFIYFTMRNFYMGGGIEGEFKINNLEKIPIPKIDSKNQKIADNIINLVNEILESKAKDSTANTAKLESKIDDLVYKLYDLDSTEIEIVKGG